MRRSAAEKCRLFLLRNQVLKNKRCNCLSADLAAELGAFELCYVLSDSGLKVPEATGQQCQRLPYARNAGPLCPSMHHRVYVPGVSLASSSIQLGRNRPIQKAQRKKHKATLSST